MTDQPVISFSGVNKTFHHDFPRKTCTALHDLRFAVAQGEVFGIIGPNGAGKSTTLKILMGFIKADGGAVSINGRPPADSSVHQRIGYLPENPCLYENLTITDHLRFGARTTGFVGNVPQRIQEILALVDLSPVARQPIRSFSKGMTQRAALAYALFHEPAILILDEPMSGLDPLGRQMVVDIIRDYNARGNTILFCSHILTDAERICSRIGIMNRGRLVIDLRPEELPVPCGEMATKSPLEAFFMETIAKDLRGSENE